MSKMLEKMTKRERALIYVLLCMILIMVSWFLIITPLLNRKSDVQNQLDNENAKKDYYEMELASFESMHFNEETKKQQLENEADKLSTVLYEEELSQKLTTLMINNGLSVQSLSIDEIMEDTELEYVEQREVTISVTGTDYSMQMFVNAIESMPGFIIYTMDTAEADTLVKASIKIRVYMV